MSTSTSSSPIQQQQQASVHPLADLTNATKQSANQQQLPGRKPATHHHVQAPAMVLPKSFSHNPYVGVIPSTVDEMVRVLEYRRQQQTQMRRTYSSPNFFNTQIGSTPQSPLTPHQNMSIPSNMYQFPRIPSAPTFFEEPEMMSRSGSPMMMMESIGSFSDYGAAQNQNGGGSPMMFSGGNSPVQQMPNNMQQQQQGGNGKNQRNNNNQQQQRKSGGAQQQGNNGIPPMTPPVNRQQQQASPVVGQKRAPQQQQSQQQQVQQVQQIPRQQAARSATPPSESPANSSTDSAGVMTKVYQNGRPVPRIVEDVPKVIAEADEKIVTVSVKFRHHTANFKTTRLQIIAGDFVVVDGDRGMDLGRVLDRVDAEALAAAAAQAAKDGNTNASPSGTQGNVQRLATEEELEVYKNLEVEEAKALEFARTMASRHLNGKLILDHVSFQFDHEKLTLWYRAPDRVYFVPLLKALNQEYKCRIWMERIEDGTENQQPQQQSSQHHNAPPHHNHQSRHEKQQAKAAAAAAAKAEGAAARPQLPSEKDQPTLDSLVSKEQGTVATSGNRKERRQNKA